MRPDENKPNILEQMVKSMYEEDSHVINVFVFYYDEELKKRSVLLSDRGFSMPTPNDEVLAYNFNLSSKAFITYAFSNVDERAPEGTSQQIIDAYKHTRNNVSVRMDKNNLDALCRRYEINNSNRQLHGALLDSEILAEVYLAMTGGQTSLSLSNSIDGTDGVEAIRRLAVDRIQSNVIQATAEELEEHKLYLAMLEKKSRREVVWQE